MVDGRKPARGGGGAVFRLGLDRDAKNFPKSRAGAGRNVWALKDPLFLRLCRNATTWAPCTRLVRLVNVESNVTAAPAPGFSKSPQASVRCRPSLGLERLPQAYHTAYSEPAVLGGAEQAHSCHASVQIPSPCTSILLHTRRVHLHGRTDRPCTRVDLAAVSRHFA